MRGPALILLVLLGVTPAMGLEPDQVLVVVNEREPASVEVGKHYLDRRGIPPQNLVRLSTSVARQIDRNRYEKEVRDPIRAHLADKNLRSRILCIVTTYGVPYVVGGGGRAGKAAVDSELAFLDLATPRLGERWIANPFFTHTSPGPDVFTRRFGMFMTGRLDGPDAETAKALVDRAIEAEQKGVTGRGYFDARGMKGSVGYAAGDVSIRAAARHVSGAGYATLLEDTGELFGGGACPDASWYWGWYSRGKFVDAFEGRMGRGAVCCHIASSEAVHLRKGTGWCLGFLRAGATAVMGPVDEPYLSAFPRGEVFFRTLLGDRSLGEAYWRSLPVGSWMMVLIGDPLYRPLRRHPRAFLRVVRVRIEDPPPGGNGDGIPFPGETVTLHVDLRLADNGSGEYPGAAASLVSGSSHARVVGEARHALEAIPPGKTAVVGPYRLRIERKTPSFARIPLQLRLEGETPRDVRFTLTASAARLTWLDGAETAPCASPDGRRLAFKHAGRLLVRSLTGEDPDLAYAARRGSSWMPMEWSQTRDLLLAGQMTIDPRTRRPRGVGLAVLDTTSGEWLPVPGGAAVEAAAWSPSGEIILAAGRTVAVWSPVTGAVDEVFRAPPDALHLRFGVGLDLFAYMLDGEAVIAPCEGPILARMPVAEGAVLARVDRACETMLVVGPSGATLLSLSNPDHPLALGSDVAGLEMAPRGGLTLLLSRSRKARIANPAWGKALDVGQATLGAWDPQGRRLAVCGLKPRGGNGDLTPTGIRLLDGAGKELGVLAPFEQFGTINDLKMAPNGRVLFITAMRELALDVWAVPAIPR
jgi:uncharacterized protein (TIGR03790 family)